MRTWKLQLAEQLGAPQVPHVSMLLLGRWSLQSEPFPSLKFRKQTPEKGSAGTPGKSKVLHRN